jgi:carbon-monoxide dehydrogenase large subunit
MMETAAREVGISPAEFRRKNFIRSFPHQTPVIMCYDAGDYDASLDAAMKRSTTTALPPARRKPSRGKLRGIGSPATSRPAVLRRQPGGRLARRRRRPLGIGGGAGQSGRHHRGSDRSHSHGQGHETTFAQLVAERFGVGIDTVSIVHGDTDKVQFGMGTYGSRSGAVGMSAIVKALDKVEAKAKKIAAHLMEAAEGDIVIEAASSRSQAPTRAAVVPGGACRLHRPQPAGRHGAGAEGRRVLRPDQLHLPGRHLHLRGRGRSGNRQDRNRHFVAADDFGKIINPMIVEGQVHGGVAQGIGQALLEGTPTTRKPASC